MNARDIGNLHIMNPPRAQVTMASCVEKRRVKIGLPPDHIKML